MEFSEFVKHHFGILPYYIGIGVCGATPYSVCNKKRAVALQRQH